MQNRLNLKQKDHDGSRKTTCRERGKKYHFQKGGGINIIFGPKYRPLYISVEATSGACRCASPERKSASSYIYTVIRNDRSISEMLQIHQSLSNHQPIHLAYFTLVFVCLP